MTAPPHRMPHPDTPESRARWLHDIGGLSIEEIGWRLGLPGDKVRALLTQDPATAVKMPGGLGAARLLRRLRHRLVERYGLSEVSIAPLGSAETDPMPAIGAAAARHLVRLVQARGGPKVIGVSHGRTIAAMVGQLPELRLPALRFVSLLGELTFAHTAYPHVVMNALAQRLGAQGFPFPTALYAQTTEERRDLMRQSVVAKVLDMAREADVWIVGIGRGAPENQLHGSGMIGAADLAQIVAQGAMCEILGRFFDAEGRELRSDLSARVMAPDAADFRGRKVIGLAGGLDKLAAIRAAVTGGLVQELVIDSRTALALLPDADQEDFAALLG